MTTEEHVNLTMSSAAGGDSVSQLVSELVSQSECCHKLYKPCFICLFIYIFSAHISFFSFNSSSALDRVRL